MQNLLSLGLIVDTGGGRSNLGRALGFTDIFFPIFWTFLIGKFGFLFSYYKRSAAMYFFSSVGGGPNAKIVTSWGQELILVAAVLIWIIIWGLLAFFLIILWTCLNGKFVLLFSNREVIAFSQKNKCTYFVILRDSHNNTCGLQCENSNNNNISYEGAM